MMPAWIRTLATALAILATVPALHAQKPPPQEAAAEGKSGMVALPCGLAKGFTTTAARPFRKIDSALRDGKTEIEEAALDRGEAEDRPPPPGRRYAIVRVALKAGRSLSRYDYALRIGDATYDALAVTPTRSAFDERLVKVARGLQEKQPKEADLIFLVPSDTRDALLVPALPMTLPPEPQKLPLPALKD
ncbi:MAG: hypothetical protein WC789_05675 [Lentisphaeria bacterium]|jgi:hypothetical protein